MRRIVTNTFISLDGVVQAPGGPEEDTSDGFAYGGWSMPYGDEKFGEFMTELMSREFDMLFGRKTYDIFASYWPNQPEGEVSKPFNDATKYVVSRSPQTFTWENSVQVEGDAIEGIRKLKETDGPELHMWGSSDLAHTLLKTDLIDQMVLITCPVVLGAGKRIFDGNSLASSFKAVHASVADSGAIMAIYDRAGDVVVGQAE
jgi:dihydrofolate reductase